jgi:hypothetical protein
MGYFRALMMCKDEEVKKIKEEFERTGVQAKRNIYTNAP